MVIPPSTKICLSGSTEDAWPENGKTVGPPFSYSAFQEIRAHNQAFSDRYFAGQSPIGRQVALDSKRQRTMLKSLG